MAGRPKIDMKIVAQYDFNGGKNKVLTQYANELAQITQAIHNINAAQFKTKVSKNDDGENVILPR
ncbi:MAG: hypothetical protein QM520_04225 [Gammaproteobacteria bacterium]|nr:hypothetical protein [Gammaproteobacteria bacterium]